VSEDFIKRVAAGYKVDSNSKAKRQIKEGWERR